MQVEVGEKPSKGVHCGQKSLSEGKSITQKLNNSESESQTLS